MKTNTITTYTYSYNPQIKRNDNQTKGMPETAQKLTVLAASTAGMLTTLAICGKTQKLNVLKLKELSKIEIGAKEILAIAGGSIAGGLLSGILTDKSNKQAKLREGFQQMVGNVIFPVTFVSLANWLYGKTSIQKHIPKINNRIANAFLQALPATVITIAALTSGIFAGNKFACRVNDRMFRKNEDRNIKVTDFAAHVDDVFLGATLVAKNLSKNSTSIVGSAASKLVPPALIIPGYMTGTASNKDFE